MARAAEVVGGLATSLVSLYLAMWMLKHGPWLPTALVADDPNYVPTWFELNLRSIFLVSFFGSLAIGFVAGFSITRKLLRNPHV